MACAFVARLYTAVVYKNTVVGDVKGHLYQPGAHVTPLAQYLKDWMSSAQAATF